MGKSELPNWAKAGILGLVAVSVSRWLPVFIPIDATISGIIAIIIVALLGNFINWE